MIKDFILSSSKGLLEIASAPEASPTKLGLTAERSSDSGSWASTLDDAVSDVDSDYDSTYSRSEVVHTTNIGGRVQFIHEVVEDYFLSEAGFGVD